MEGSMNSFIGGFANIMLDGISYTDFASVELKQFYPKFIFVAFQGTFAAITVAIIAGSIIERIKFSTWLKAFLPLLFC
jgi:Amt family ammonium transporter